MFQHRCHKRIAFEHATYFFKVAHLFLTASICSESGHGSQRKFLLGIFVHHFIQPHYSFLPLAYDSCDVCRCNRISLQAIEFKHFFIRPRPFIRIIIGVHFCKTVVYLIHTVQTVALNIFHQAFYLTLRGNQSGNIHPFSCSNRRIRNQTSTDFFIRSKMNGFQTLDDRVSQKFMDSSLIKLDSLIQCRIFDFRTLIRVNLGSFPRHTSQFLQNLSASHHLLNSVRTQQVIINLVQTVRVFPLVTFRPLLRITNCTYTPQIDTRHQISCILFLYQIRKRQIRSIRMSDMTSHHQ